ncbi:NAD(P)/FAD-dependent oxidoreductase [uncultured Tistrella sp.]|uniref:NAD(P)/FAD-dependent oxidoreductase n=1 Tax=Tistrella mobilis TaxID=171437 RepID=UPI000C0B5F41|nr:tryptophan 7-halogenase [uncultured Tistrella sp.]MAM72426.1 fad dependent oxidoreductase [Tistrella sp.]
MSATPTDAADGHPTRPAAPAGRVVDVLIAGGGPAGAVAAHALAMAGRRAMIADPGRTHADANDTKIGEALPGAAAGFFRAAGLPPPDPERHTRVRGSWSAWATAELEATDFLRSPDGPGWRLDRPAFDAALRQAAIDAGAGRRRARVVAVRRESGDTAPDVAPLWRVDFSDRGPPVRARWLIDATGRRAALARQLGAGRLRDDRLIAIFARISVTDGPMADPGFDRTVIEAVPEGWWYAARLPSGAVMAALHTSPATAARILADRPRWHAARLAAPHLARLTGHADAGAALDQVAACDAGGTALDLLAGPGWIAAGDAAQAYDPLSAQGLLSALHAGRQAARAVDAALGGDSSAIPQVVTAQAHLRAVYRGRLAAYYAQAAGRFPGAEFWMGRAGQG